MSVNGKSQHGVRIDRSHLVRFVALFLFWLAVVAALWPFLQTGYNRAVVGVSGVLFSLVESPNVTQVRAQKDEVLVYRQVAGQSVPFQVFTRFVYVAFVPLLALLLATPNMALLRRAKITVIAVGCLFFFHVIYIVAAVELGYVFVGLTAVSRTGYRLLDWLQVLMRILWEVVAVLIWGGLTFRYWLRKPEATRG